MLLVCKYQSNHQSPCELGLCHLHLCDPGVPQTAQATAHDLRFADSLIPMTAQSLGSLPPRPSPLSVPPALYPSAQSTQTFALFCSPLLITGPHSHHPQPETSLGVIFKGSFPIPGSCLPLPQDWCPSPNLGQAVGDSFFSHSLLHGCLRLGTQIASSQLHYTHSLPHRSSHPPREP